MTISQKEVIAKLHQLPSLPLVVQAVIASFSDTCLDTTTLAHKISLDQGLSARVLRVANSSFYGLPRKVGSIQEAVIVLGFDSVRSLVLSAGMIKTFPVTPGSLFDRKAYWRRCFRVAVFSKAMAKCLRVEQPLAFTAGMFHDVGLLVLDLCIPQQFTALLQQQAATGEDLIGIERGELGFDHTVIGAEIIRLWNFPAEIERVVRDWHKLESEPFEPLAGMVHVAVLLESGLSGEDLMTRLPQVLKDRFQITWERIEACLPESAQLDAASVLASSH